MEVLLERLMRDVISPLGCILYGGFVWSQVFYPGYRNFRDLDLVLTQSNNPAEAARRKLDFERRLSAAFSPQEAQFRSRQSRGLYLFAVRSGEHHLEIQAAAGKRIFRTCGKFSWEGAEGATEIPVIAFTEAIAETLHAAITRYPSKLTYFLDLGMASFTPHDREEVRWLFREKLKASVGPKLCVSSMFEPGNRMPDDLSQLGLEYAREYLFDAHAILRD